MSILKPATEFKHPLGQMARFTFTLGRPPVRSTVAVAEAFRAAVLSAFHAITGSKDSLLFSGHQPNGQPDKDHRHAYYLPEPNTDGALVGIVVVSPQQRFSKEEIEALSTVKALRWNGPSTKVSLELADADTHRFLQVATRWVSATPYVPLRRFWGTHGKHHLVPAKQLSRELELVPYCKPSEVSITPWGEIRVRISKQNAGAKLSPPARLAFTAEFQTQEPICGPIALGHSAHFGLGQFVPAGVETTK